MLKLEIKAPCTGAAYNLLVSCRWHTQVGLYHSKTLRFVKHDRFSSKPWWHVCMEVTSVNSHNKGQVVWSYGGCFHVVELHKMLNNQSSCWWFMTPPRRSCDVALIWQVEYKGGVTSIRPPSLARDVLCGSGCDPGELNHLLLPTSISLTTTVFRASCLSLYHPLQDVSVRFWSNDRRHALVVWHLFNNIMMLQTRGKAFICYRLSVTDEKLWVGQASSIFIR